MSSRRPTARPGTRPTSPGSPTWSSSRPCCPRLHGFDLCQKISRESQGRVPVIIVTGLYKGPKYRQEALNGLGASDFFEKPLDPAAFLAAVKRLLRDEDDFEDELPDSNAVIEALSRRGRGPAPSRGDAKPAHKG